MNKIVNPATLALLLNCICLVSSSQEKLGSFDPGQFYPNDIALTHYDPYRGQFHFTYQSGNDITRMSLDSSLQLIQSRKLTSKEISYYRRSGSRKFYTHSISIKNGTYEIFVEEDTLNVIQTDWGDHPDRILTTIGLNQGGTDEKLLAVFPMGDKIGFLLSAFKQDKLILITWSPVNGQSIAEFPLPDSNMDPKYYKEYPKDTRINFKKQLVNPIVQPMGQTSIHIRPGPQLYYSDTAVFILMHVPFSLGVFTIHLDLTLNRIVTQNYEVNPLLINAGNNNALIMHPAACMADSVLIIKNLSVNKFEYLFYNAFTHRLIRKWEAKKENIDLLAHSSIRQKGTWASAKEEKEFSSKEAYFKKGNGLLYLSGSDKDSITVTSLLVHTTTGITGALLDALVPLPLGISSQTGYYLSLLIPPLGSKREKIFYFHSRFALEQFQPASFNGVRTALDNMLDHDKNEKLFEDLCFYVRKKGEFCMGSYSKDDKKIHVIRYREK